MKAIDLIKRLETVVLIYGNRDVVVHTVDENTHQVFKLISVNTDIIDSSEKKNYLPIEIYAKHK